MVFIFDGRGGLSDADAVDKLLAEDRLRPLFLFEAMPTRVVEAAELADVDPTFQTVRNRLSGDLKKRQKIPSIQEVVDGEFALGATPLSWHK